MEKVVCAAPRINLLDENLEQLGGVMFSSLSRVLIARPGVKKALSRL